MTRPIVNPELIKLARSANLAAKVALEKRAFLPGNDPSLTGGGPPPGGGGDPAAMGMDPSMMMGGGGGAPPPPPPPAGGGGGGGSAAELAQMIMQHMQTMQGGAGGAGASAGAGIKPKIDVNVTLLQILKILARITDHLQIPIPASEMVATQGDLTSFAQQQQTDPTGAMAAGGGQGAFPPIGGIQPAFGGEGGGGGKQAAAKQAGTGWDDIGDRAAAIRRVMRRAAA